MQAQEPRFIKLYDFFSGNLFPDEKYSLVIPNYQRGYKWAVKNKDEESSVEYLVRTIIDSSNSELFLQGITVSDTTFSKEGKRQIIIIDGQQRLTTFYLLLWYLNKDLIANIDLIYDARKDTDDTLKKLKELDYSENIVQDDIVGDITKQDIFFIRDAIKQIDTLVSSKEKSDLIKFLQEKIKVIYIPINNNKDAVGTFTMMNGNKAIMRAEELIKAELLRMVSLSHNLSFEASSMEEILIKLREISAIDWNTAETRARYAREWDKWLYWWNRPAVKAFYRTTTETRPLGLLLDYFYRKEEAEHHTYNGFKQFKSKWLEGRNYSSIIADEVFSKLRKLQKQFEDAYNDIYTHNMLCMALSCADRFPTICFFLDHLNIEGKEETLQKFTEALMINASIEVAAKYASKDHMSDEERKNIQEAKDNFTGSLLNEYVYNVSNENAFRYLSYRNVIEANKLGERFNASIFLNRSLEHIHPKSKVYHIDKENHKLKNGGDDDVKPEASAYPNPMPNNTIKRDDIRDDSVMPSLVLSEHSICNLVLLYGQDNSTFGAKSFAEKKKIFFNVTDEKKIFISRTLQHTLSIFAAEEWGIPQMIAYYKENKDFLEKEFLI